jgi:hypothetical protein
MTVHIDVHHNKESNCRRWSVCSSTTNATQIDVPNGQNDVTPTMTPNDDDKDEYWQTMTTATQMEHQCHILDFGPYGALQYNSMSSHTMTPLDMIYAEKDGADNNNDDDDDESCSYDGTGHLLWLAAVTLAHLLAYRLDCLLPYLPKVERDKSSGDHHSKSIICELGCGTGVGGMATILFHCLRPCGDNNRSVIATTTPGFHVVFTDNDVDTLELCQSNCKLNGIDPQTYSHQLLRWGRENLSKDNNSELGLWSHSIDTVIATDVVYDLKMIRPLMETAIGLLKLNGSGYFILSHIPRFCLPRNEIAEESVGRGAQPRECHTIGTRDGNEIGAFAALEDHIVSQANVVGLVLVDTIRPADELVNDLPMDAGDVHQKNHRDLLQHLTVKHIEEAQAVVFVFVASSKSD